MATKNSMLSMEINEDVVKPVLEKQIQQAIISNIGNIDRLFEFMIQKALKERVDPRDGKASSYSNQSVDFIDYLSKKSIQDATKEAIQSFISDNSEDLKKTLTKELQKEKNKRKIIDAFITGACKNFETSWNFNCNVDFERKKSSY